MEKPGEAFEGLVEVMRRLRSPTGCPWDRAQDDASLKTYLIEEAYEVLDAIDSGEPEGLRDELGDILMHIVFFSVIHEERGEFGPGEVAARSSEKMIARHPHVFGDLRLETPDEVRDEWERIKAREKVGRERGHLGGVPDSLPALLQAHRLGEKAGGVGFDWRNPLDLLSKLDEEVAEFKEALGTGEGMAEELGDLFFTLANLSRHLGVNPEEALRQTNRKFRRRFAEVERRLAERGTPLGEASLEEMDALWEEAKKGEAP